MGRAGQPDVLRKTGASTSIEMGAADRVRGCESGPRADAKVCAAGSVVVTSRTA